MPEITNLGYEHGLLQRLTEFGSFKRPPMANKPKTAWTTAL